MMERHINIVLNAADSEQMISQVEALYTSITDDTLQFTAQPVGENLPLADEYFYSGGVALPTGPSHPERRDALFKGIHLAAKHGLPQFGICFGVQAFARAHGGYLDPVVQGGARGPHYDHIDFVSPQLASRVKELGITDPVVEEDHAWSIRPSTIEKLFTIAATSTNGPEIIWHKSLPVAGCQFHPEITDTSTDGAQIFGALRELILSRSHSGVYR